MAPTGPGPLRAVCLQLALLAPFATGCAAVDGAAQPAARGSASGVAPASAARDGAAAAGAPAPEEDEQRYLRGWLSSRYRARFGGGEDDHDLFTTLGLDFGDSAEDAVTGSFMGRMTADLGGDEGLFSGLDDTYDSSLNGKVYHAYVDVHSVEALETLRFGRQRIWETPELIVFDGALLETGGKTLGGINLGIYGGVPAHFYESSPAGDSVVGAFAEGQPWKGGRARLDYMYLEDETKLGDHQNDLLGLSLWQFLGERVVLEADYTRLEDEDRDVSAAASYQDPESDLALRVSYYRLLETQRNYALEADPYYASLRDYEPHYQVGLLASKSVVENLALQLGVDVRRLEDSADEGDFNHEFEHYFLTATIPAAFAPSVALSLTGDYWEDDQQDVRTWGADLTHRINARLRGSLGTYYSLYKYDLFFDSERDDVRTYYVRLRYERSQALSFDAGFDYEDDDFEEYQTLRLGARWLF